MAATASTSPVSATEFFVPMSKSPSATVDLHQQHSGSPSVMVVTEEQWQMQQQHQAVQHHYGNGMLDGTDSSSVFLQDSSADKQLPTHDEDDASRTPPPPPPSHHHHHQSSNGHVMPHPRGESDLYQSYPSPPPSSSSSYPADAADYSQFSHYSPSAAVNTSSASPEDDIEAMASNAVTELTSLSLPYQTQQQVEGAAMENGEHPSPTGTKEDSYSVVYCTYSFIQAPLKDCLKVFQFSPGSPVACPTYAEMYNVPTSSIQQQPQHHQQNDILSQCMSALGDTSQLEEQLCVPQQQHQDEFGYSDRMLNNNNNGTNMVVGRCWEDQETKYDVEECCAPMR